MTENQVSNEQTNRRDQCRRMCEGRGSRFFCGIFLIILGLFWFGKKADWFPPEFITLFWPLALVAAGIWFIAAAWMSKRNEH